LSILIAAYILKIRSPRPSAQGHLTTAGLNKIPIVQYDLELGMEPQPLHQEERSWRMRRPINLRSEPETHQHATPGLNRQETCAICGADFTLGEDVRRLPCGHLFHPRCVDPWLLEHAATCPLW
jgi:hypothetical protein